MSHHGDVVRQSFTVQAAAYAAQPWISDTERMALLVATAAPKAEDRVLDVACGPGYVAEAFSHVCREVVGVDLTEAPLRIAEERCRARGIKNLSFRIGDVQELPFADSEFNMAVCRLAVHHFPQPQRVVNEMARACRVGGTVVLEDIVASEHPMRAAYQHRIEVLRDPSHTRTLPLSELLCLFRDAGIEVEKVMTGTVVPEVERWLATTKTTPEHAAEVRRLIEADMAEDLSGTRPFRDEQGQLRFHHLSAIVAGRKL
jgi:2-polyprenyl-3-methyl-5-hydroxy-6-metoxy-1,4-benzoquinol methylase